MRIKVYNNNHDVCTQILTLLAADAACVTSGMSREHFSLMFTPSCWDSTAAFFPHQAWPDPPWLGQLPLHTLSLNQFPKISGSGQSPDTLSGTFVAMTGKKWQSQGTTQ